MSDKPEKKRAPLLIDEMTILVYPSLAVALGINKAIVFQQLHFLLNGQKESKNKHNFTEGRWWVYNSYPEWRRDYFPWLSISSLKGIFLGLEKDGLVIAQQSVKNKSDRKKWYTIDYEQWDKFCLMIGQNLSHQPSDKNSPMDGTKTIPSKRQKLADGYSETSSETSSKNTENTAESAATAAAPPLEVIPVVNANNAPYILPEMLPSKPNGIKETAHTSPNAENPTPSSAAPLPVDEPRAEIFTLYEQAFGRLVDSAMLKDELKDAAETFPMDWIRDALKETILAGVKNWKYTRKILERWQLEGRPQIAIVPKSAAPTKSSPQWTPTENKVVETDLTLEEIDANMRAIMNGGKTNVSA